MKLSTAEAAKILTCSIEHIHWGMQQDVFTPPIGSAVRGKSGKYSYNIQSSKLARYLNKSEDEVIKEVMDIRENAAKKAKKEVA